MKKYLIFLFLLILNLKIFSAHELTRIERAKKSKYKTFKKFKFKIFKNNNWTYKFSDTEIRDIKNHRWINNQNNEVIEIKVAKDFIHFVHTALVDFYSKILKKKLKSHSIIEQGRRNLKNKWIWIARFNATTKKNKKVKIHLIINKHSNNVYFISVTYPASQKISKAAKKIINSIRFI